MRAYATPILALFLCVSLAAGTGCYTGHAISMDKLREVSNDVERGVVEIESEEGTTLPVGPDTVLVVTDNDGLRHPLQPFTYKVSSTQLVAPEQDLILGLSTIEGVEIRKLSAVATIGLVAIGLATVGTMAVLVFATAGDSSFQ